MNRTIWLTGLVLVACGGSSSGGTLDAGLVSDGAFVEPTDASTLDAQTDAQVESPSTAVALDTEGLTIARGHVGWFLAEDCVGLDNCYANNPATPYGLIFLPPAADEALPEIPPPFLDGDLRAAWRLAGDEAVVLVGRTPPESAYYGFTPYLYEREGTELFASLGDTLNPDVVGESPFDREIAYVFVSNAALAERITRALRSVGLGDDAIFVQPIPTEYVRFGHDTAADALSFLVRTALPTDEAAMEAYRVDTPFEVFRVQGGEALEPGSLATLPIRPKGLEGVNEDDLADALDALRNAVVLRHGGVPVPFVNTEFEG
ncbi:MAG: hypothetical protein KC586_07710, partial [Myxococcales bacterium]|nr:hypothetical protein [Myxococcales bacterium]